MRNISRDFHALRVRVKAAVVGMERLGKLTYSVLPSPHRYRCNVSLLEDQRLRITLRNGLGFWRVIVSIAYVM